MLLAKNPSLCSAAFEIEDIKASANFLKKQNFSTAEILTRPKILLLNKMTLANRVKVLNECCFIDFKVLYLYKFVSLMNKNIDYLKGFNYVDPTANIPSNLLKLLDIPVTLTTTINESVTLSKTRENIINFYLKAKLEMTSEELAKLWKVYGVRLKSRNIESIVKIIDILENELEFSKQRIIKNGFLLGGCPENLSKMLSDIPAVGGVPFKEIIHQRPKIVMQQVDSISDIIKHVKSFNIPEDRLVKCVEVLTLSSDTVRERLNELSNIDEFKVLISNPRVLRLIHFQTKAKTRLEYLKQLKLNCMSLHVLTGPSDIFEKYAKVGIDKVSGRDSVIFLSETFNIEQESVREYLSRHPNSFYVPVLKLKAAIDYLREKLFTDQEISENMYLLLYPVSKIDHKLASLLQWREENDGSRFICGVSLSKITNTQLLNLCLYYIEADYHFTGDGTWDLTRYTSNEMFPTTIPEFPKTLSKELKFGATRNRKNLKVE